MDNHLSDPQRAGLGLPAIGGIDMLTPLRKSGVTQAKVAIAECEDRLRLAHAVEAIGSTRLPIVRASATTAALTRIAADRFDATHVGIEPRSASGRCDHQWRQTVGHDWGRHDGNDVAPGIHMGRSVEVGRTSFIGRGRGSVWVGRDRIGDHAVLGIDSAGWSSDPHHRLAFGTPVRVVRRSDNITITHANGWIAKGMINARTSTMVTLVVTLLNRREIRFLLAGAYNTVFGYLAFLLVYWTLAAMASAELCVAISYLPSLVNAYLVQKYFVFHPAGWLSGIVRPRTPPANTKPSVGTAAEFVRFSIVNTSVLLINLAFLPLAISYGGMRPPMAQALFLVLAVTVSYFAHRTFSFRSQTRE
ncbi:MAG: GtrA family protein [Dokdonella sp.]